MARLGHSRGRQGLAPWGQDGSCQQGPVQNREMENISACRQQELLFSLFVCELLSFVMSGPGKKKRPGWASSALRDLSLGGLSTKEKAKIQWRFCDSCAAGPWRCSLSQPRPAVTAARGRPGTDRRTDGRTDRRTDRGS